MNMRSGSAPCFVFLSSGWRVGVGEIHIRKEGENRSSNHQHVMTDFILDHTYFISLLTTVSICIKLQLGYS